jgi:hypothetical protein
VQEYTTTFTYTFFERNLFNCHLIVIFVTLKGLALLTLQK